MEELKKCVDEYIKLKQHETELKEQLNYYKNFFELQAQTDLQDKKSKNIKYYGSNNSFIQVSSAQSIKLSELELLQNLFGDKISKILAEKVTFEFISKYKKSLGLIVNNNMIDGTLDDLLSSITSDKNIKELLKKKLKGNYQKDKDILLNMLNLSEEEASDTAYLTSEVLAFDTFIKMLELLDYKGDKQKALEVLQSAITVSESCKINCYS